MPADSLSVTLHPVDYLCIGAYFVLLLVIGFRFARSRTSDDEDYLLAGRALTLPGFVATLVSTWYGGILGVGEFAYQYGLSSWVVFGVPYYIFAALFALFLAKKVRNASLYTIPDRLYEYYDKKTGLLGSLFTFLMVSPAPYILMLAVLIQLLFGWAFVPSLLAGTLVSMIYVYLGGFRSVIRTDYLQFGLMFAGFILLLVMAVKELGGIRFLTDALPPRHLEWHGGHSAQYILVWFFIAVWTLVDPGFHQRCYGARDGGTARRGIFISIGFWAIFDFLTTTTGLYARAAFDQIHPLMAYPALAEAVLPVVLKGIFYAGMIAVIMSTVDSFSFLSAVTVGRDLLWRGFGEKLSLNSAFLSRIGLIVTGIVAVIMVLAIPSVIDLWYTIGTLFIPALLIPLLSTYFSTETITGTYAFTVSLGGFLTSAGWYAAGILGSATDGWTEYPLNLEPLYPGLVISGVIYLVARWDLAAKTARQVDTTRDGG